MALIKIEGLDRLNATLDRIPQRLRQRAARRALYRAAAFIRDEARRGAPVDTGRLRKGIVVRSSRAAGRGGVAYKVGLRKDAWYGRLVEFGHVSVGAGRKIKGGDRLRSIRRDAILQRGGRFVPPQPFMRPAAGRLDRALDLFAVELRDRIGSGEVFE